MLTEIHDIPRSSARLSRHLYLASAAVHGNLLLIALCWSSGLHSAAMLLSLAATLPFLVWLTFVWEGHVRWFSLTATDRTLAGHGLPHLRWSLRSFWFYAPPAILAQFADDHRIGMAVLLLAQAVFLLRTVTGWHHFSHEKAPSWRW